MSERRCGTCGHPLERWESPDPQIHMEVWVCPPCWERIQADMMRRIAAAFRPADHVLPRGDFTVSRHGGIYMGEPGPATRWEPPDPDPEAAAFAAWLTTARPPEDTP